MAQPHPLTSSRIKKQEKLLIVTHMHPDTDAWFCTWLMSRVVGTTNGQVNIAFVRAGERLSREREREYKADGFHIEYVDTGKGKFDQHEKFLKHSSSFELLAKAYELEHDAGIAPLIKLANDADNVVPIDRTSIHFLIRSLPYHFKKQQRRGAPDDAHLIDVWAFIETALDAMTNQWRHAALQEAKFDRNVIQPTKGGLKLAVLINAAAQREVAFRAGADVVVFTESKGKGQYFVVAQVTRVRPEIDLTPVVAELRSLEGEKRKLVKNGYDYTVVGNPEWMPTWHLHDSRRFASAGTRTHPLSPEDMTKLSIGEIVETFTNLL